MGARERREFLFVQSTTEQGGAETVLLNALAADARLRTSSLVVSLGFGKGDLGRRLRERGVEVIELAPARLRQPHLVLRRALTIASIVRARGVRVVIGNGAHPQVFGALAARLAGSRSAYFVHMIHRVPLLANPMIDMLAIRGPLDMALANSRATLEAIRRLRSGMRVELLYPGTPIALASIAGASETRAALGIAPSEILYGIFGRLQRWKGQDVFLDAAARVVEVLPNSRFWVVGGSVFGLEPEFAEELSLQAKRLGLSGRVAFLGQQANIGPLMAACDVVCHATRVAEPFGMVIIEAMAQGRPVIGTRSGGPSEIVVDGDTGLLAAPGDADELAAKMIELGRNPDLRSRMGAAALERATTAFSSEAFAGRLRSLLETV